MRGLALLLAREKTTEKGRSIFSRATENGPAYCECFGAQTSAHSEVPALSPGWCGRASRCRPCWLSASRCSSPACSTRNPQSPMSRAILPRLWMMGRSKVPEIRWVVEFTGPARGSQCLALGWAASQSNYVHRAGGPSNKRCQNVLRLFLPRCQLRCATFANSSLPHALRSPCGLHAWRWVTWRQPEPPKQIAGTTVALE